jgi:hypothetical protein
VLFEGSIPVAGIEKSAIPDAKSLADLRAFISSTTKLYARESTFLAFERRDGEA